MLNIKRILVVDDDKALCDVLSFLFSMEGFQSNFIHDGSNVLNVLKEFKPDIVLVDYLLPDKHGPEICSEIREWKQGMPIILYTAFCKAAIGLNKCYDALIEKPFDLSFLITEIKRLLNSELVD